VSRSGINRRAFVTGLGAVLAAPPTWIAIGLVAVSVSLIAPSYFHDPRPLFRIMSFVITFVFGFVTLLAMFGALIYASDMHAKRRHDIDMFRALYMLRREREAECNLARRSTSNPRVAGSTPAGRTTT
jgi:hypothetical protein